MKGQAVPDTDHVGRYCKASTVENGEISAAAFMVGKTEEYLSVNWLEEINRSDRTTQISELQSLYATKLRVGAAARIAVLNVGSVRAKVQRDSPDNRLLRVLHEPESDDPSHAGIYDIPYDDDIVAELIAQVILETHAARA
jgi:hypothetical protein